MGEHKHVFNLASGRRDQSGQAILEYIFILAFTGLLALGLGRAVVDAIDGGVLSFGARLEKQLKTGRAPVSIWEN